MSCSLRSRFASPSRTRARRWCTQTPHSDRRRAVFHTIKFSNTRSIYLQTMLKALVQPDATQRPSPQNVVAWVNKRRRQQVGWAHIFKRSPEQWKATRQNAPRLKKSSGNCVCVCNGCQPACDTLLPVIAGRRCGGQGRRQRRPQPAGPAAFAGLSRRSRLDMGCPVWRCSNCVRASPSYRSWLGVGCGRPAVSEVCVASVR